MSIKRIAVPPTELPLNLNDRRAPIFWGMVGLIVIEAMVFASLVVSYYYLKFYSSEWPLGGISKPDLVLPSINALILFASSIPVHWADKNSTLGNIRKTKIGLIIAFVMGAVFLVLKVVEYSGYDYNWATNAYGSIVWTTTGFHTAHVIAVLIKTGVVLAAAFRGHFDGNRTLGVSINGMYWHFVVAAWVPLFFTLYLASYLLE